MNDGVACVGVFVCFVLMMKQVVHGARHADGATDKLNDNEVCDDFVLLVLIFICTSYSFE